MLLIINLGGSYFMQADAPIKMLWIGNQLSPIEQFCMKSFLYHGHQVDLYAYTDIKGVPSGVIMRDANEIVESKKFLNIWAVMQPLQIYSAGHC